MPSADLPVGPGFSLLLADLAPYCRLTEARGVYQDSTVSVENNCEDPVRAPSGFR
jgi:hypothetical protein